MTHVLGIPIDPALRLWPYPERVLRVLLAALVLSLLVAACATEDPTPGPQVAVPAGVKPVRAVGAAEDRLALLAPAGYAADTAGFTRTTGCAVTIKHVSTSDQVVRLLSTGRYDGALGTGDATVRLISSGGIAPVNTRLVPNYRDVFDGLKQQPFNSVGGQMFAVPVGRAADLLTWRRDKIPGTLGNLGAIFDPAQAASYGGQITVPDDPTEIAAAAAWLIRQREDLKITDPYELDHRQFNAVIDVLRHQQPYVGEYWRDPADVREAFQQGEAIVGMARQGTVGELQAGAGTAPIDATLPPGATGRSPAWMVAAKARHPNCMYRWLDHALDPHVDAQVALVTQIAPSVSTSCDVLAAAGHAQHCTLFHADDDGYYEQVLYRTSPSRDCGDARGRACMGWDAWIKAWAAVRRGR